MDSSLRSCRSTPVSNGFSLIELLSVIAVVAVLAAIVLSVTHKIRDTAAKVSATSNYRQIGTAIQMFIADNSGSLPGSLRVGQSSSYSDRGSGKEMLGYHLWTYLDLPEPIATSNTAPIFENLLTIRNRRADNSPMFVVNNRVPTNANTIINPWGYTDNQQNPGSSSRLDHIASPGTTWALQDIDALHRASQGAGWQAATPARPALGDARLSLYFDWHVGEEPAGL